MEKHWFNRIHLSGSAAYFFFIYFLLFYQRKVSEQSWAYWSLVFAPSLHQLSLLSLFAIISIFLFFAHTHLIAQLFINFTYLLFNYPIGTHYEDRQIYDETSLECFS